MSVAAVMAAAAVPGAAGVPATAAARAVASAMPAARAPAIGAAAAASGVAPANAAGAPDVAPPPDTAIPTSAPALAQQIEAGDARLRAAIGEWRTAGDPALGGPPDTVTLEALAQQRTLRMLSRHPQLARATIRRLAPRLARDTREIVAALGALRRLSAGSPPPRRRLRTAPAEPLGVLMRHYAEAQKRFGAGRHVLAAVHLIETAFGKVVSNSSAGAQGPMQFLPATWRAYGLGGDIQDPRDAILGAANYLRASGAPRDYARALFAYNHSTLYVDAIRRYARFIDRNRDGLYMLYSWQVYARGRDGNVRRMTGPGLG